MSIAPKTRKIRVLFVCVHNSARSQMAEAFLTKLGGDRFEAESAGLEPGRLNPLAVEAMGEAGIDISMNRTKSVMDLYREHRIYDFVIAVCDEAARTCPVFPGPARQLHWAFDDPSKFTGSHEERLSKTRDVRDRIQERVEEFVQGQMGGKK